ncbi:MAG: CopG family transcriptional regulator [Thermomicrobiales bacterium]
MERTTVYLPTELKVSIKAAARRRGSSEADVIREALTKYIAEPDAKRPRPKTIGIIHSGEVQSDRFEEWLEENWKQDW